MKKVEAIIRKSKFEDVKKALHEVEVNFFSYWDVTGVGNEKQGHVYRGISYSTSEIQRRFLSIIVNDKKFTINGHGSEKLSLKHTKDIVLRKSAFTCSRTIAINCDKASSDIPRDFVKTLQNPTTKGIMIIDVT